MNDVILKAGGSMFCNQFMDIDNTSRKVLNNLFLEIEKDTNLVQIGGATMTSLVGRTGYSEGTIRKAMVVLNKFKLAEKTNLRGEYIVNPLFAVKGNEELVWQVYGKIEKKLQDGDMR